MKTIYVGNIPYDMNEEALVAMFAEHGFHVRKSRFVADQETGRFRGFAFLDLDDDESLEVVQAMDGLKANGRFLRVRAAHDRPASEGGRRRDRRSA